MRVGLSSLTFDLDGHSTIDLAAGSDFGTVSRRVSVAKTLDAGVAVNDGGHAEGDRLVSLVWRTRNRDYETRLRNLVQNYSRLWYSSREGFYKVVPLSYRTKEGQSTLRINIIEKLA